MNDKYLDVSILDPEKIVSYDKWEINTEEKIKHTRIGHLSVDGSGYHKYCGYNRFSKEILPIPLFIDGWLNDIESIQHDYDEYHSNEETFEDYLQSRKKSHKKWIDNHICNADAKYFVPPKESCMDKHKNCDLYKTLDNYAIGFVVLVNKDNDETYIYGMTKDVLPDNYEWNEIILFNEFIARYEALEVFIGKSIFNEMTDFSGGYGEKWDGNSILLRISHHNEFRYVYVGENVFEFVIDEKITKYVSSVGNNCVPYPYAESKNWVYDMSCYSKFPILEQANRAARGYVDTDSSNAQPIEMTVIAKRGTDNIRSSINADKPITYMLPGSHYELCANTCDNDELPLVQHVNKILGDDVLPISSLDEQQNANIYCASLQGELPANNNFQEDPMTTYGYGCIIF